MINDKVRMYLLPPLFNAAVRAGASIMKVYKNRDDYDISLKEDHTPITLADRMAHRTIREYLGPTRIPILSEEGREMRYEERCNWELYWLVDPLDGTVEFIKGNNEFTVNIALMENNVCMGAVIYVPYYEKMYVRVRMSRRASLPMRRRIIAMRRSFGAGRRCRWLRRRITTISGWPCRAPIRPPRRTSMWRACGSVSPIWKLSSRGVPTSSACWPRGGSIIMSARRTPMNGIRRPGS